MWNFCTSLTMTSCMTSFLLTILALTGDIPFTRRIAILLGVSGKWAWSPDIITDGVVNGSSEGRYSWCGHEISRLNCGSLYCRYESRYRSCGCKISRWYCRRCHESLCRMCRGEIRSWIWCCRWYESRFRWRGHMSLIIRLKHVLTSYNATASQYSTVTVTSWCQYVMNLKSPFYPS